MQIFMATLTPLSDAGSISVPGLRVGDRLIWQDNYYFPVEGCEQQVTVNDQLQQFTSLQTNPQQILVVRSPDPL